MKCDRWLKVDTASYVEQKWLWNKGNEPSPATPKARLQRSWLCVYSGIGRDSSIMSFLENKMVNSNTYCSQLDYLKAAFNKKFRISQQKMHNIPSG